MRANASDLEDLDFDDEDEDDDSLSGHRRRNTDSKYVVIYSKYSIVETYLNKFQLTTVWCLKKRTFMENIIVDLFFRKISLVYVRKLAYK